MLSRIVPFYDLQRRTTKFKRFAPFGLVVSCPDEAQLTRYGPPPQRDGAKILCNLDGMGRMQRHLSYESPVPSAGTDSTLPADASNSSNAEESSSNSSSSDAGCLVYSLGSKGNFEFERSVFKSTNCSIVTLDCTYDGKPLARYSDRHMYRTWCLGQHPNASTPARRHLGAAEGWWDEGGLGEEEALAGALAPKEGGGLAPQAEANRGVDEPLDEPLHHPARRSVRGVTMVPGGQWLSLHQMIRALGHLQKRVTVLKIDIEGWEYQVLAALADMPPHLLPIQVSVEVHYMHILPVSAKTVPDMALFFMHMAHLGYATVSLEPNMIAKSGCCSEYTLLRVAQRA